MYGYLRISILIYIASSASAQQHAGNLYCPKTWTAGQTATLEFHIDQSLFPSQCTGTTDKRPIFLRSTTANGTPQIMCRTADITATSACSSSLSAGCGCIATNGSYVLQYKIEANETIHNGWWTATVQCLDGFATQMLSFGEKQCSDINVLQEQTTTVPPSTSEIPDADKVTKDNCEDDCIAGSSVAGVIVLVGGAAAVVLWPKKIKVYVGYRREQIARIDGYADRLNDLKSALKKELKKKMNCCVCCDVSIDGNRAIQADGSRKMDTDHLHVLVQLSNITNYNKLMDISLAVNKYVKKNVRPNLARDVIVLGNATIPNMAKIEKKTKTRIFPEHEPEGNDNEAETTESVVYENGARPVPVPCGHRNKQTGAEKQRLLTENENQEYVIQIEGTDNKTLDHAEDKVKARLRNVTFDLQIDDSRKIQEEAQQFIEEMTGTTIVRLPNNPLTVNEKCSIQIEGSNKEYIEKARVMVEEFLEKNVRMVPVDFWESSMWKEQFDTIETETKTIIHTPVENGKEQYVIKIEQLNKQGNSDEAAQRVKSLFADDAPPSACCPLCRAESPPPGIV